MILKFNSNIHFGLTGLSVKARNISQDCSGLLANNTRLASNAKKAAWLSTTPLYLHPLDN